MKRSGFKVKQNPIPMKRTPIKRKGKRHCNETPETRKIVEEREWCEKGCGRKGNQIHHKVPKRMGGTTHVYGPNELEWLCDECHDDITLRRVK